MSGRCQTRLTRRSVLASAAGLGLATLTGFPAILHAANGSAGAGAEAVKTVQNLIEQKLDGRKAERSELVKLDLRARVNAGNTVPVGIAVDSPMSETDYVQSAYIFASGSPFPEIVSFHFMPGVGPAKAATRIRLEEGTQRVWVVVLRNKGPALMTWREVETAVSGCGVVSGLSPSYVMPTPKPRVKVPAAAKRGEIIRVRSQISHNMETGLRMDTAGNMLARRIINKMECAYGGRRIFMAELSPAVAANAYMNFFTRVMTTGIIQFTWHEDGGALYRSERRISVS